MRVLVQQVPAFVCFELSFLLRVCGCMIVLWRSNEEVPVVVMLMTSWLCVRSSSWGGVCVVADGKARMTCMVLLARQWSIPQTAGK